MTSRDTILAAIRQHKGGDAGQERPFRSAFVGGSGEVVSVFCEHALQVGAEWMMEGEMGDWPTFLRKQYPECKRIIYAGLPFTIPGMDAYAIQDEHPNHLHDVDLAILAGEWGVAENGAVWLPEDSLPHRVLPFITQHLIIRLDKRKIVHTMHDAYRRIDPQYLGYGLFIAGPSKTADIEQSLVKGAQGARTTLIVLHGSE